MTRVVDTYPIFNHTWDEPAHIAAGLELLDIGTYSYEQQHPPLARMAMALGPYLNGRRSERETVPEMYAEGNRILYQGERYERVLTMARLGNLPFLVVTLLATWGWARKLLGVWPAVLAVLFAATVPPLLGNAGLATLDVAVAGLGVASLIVFCDWLERPNFWSGAALGAVTGAAIMTKFSAIPFLGASFLAIVVWRSWICFRNRQRLILASSAHMKTSVAAIALLLVVFWLAYGLGTSSLADPADRPYELVDSMLGSDSRLSEIVSDIIETPVFPIFIPKIMEGMQELFAHNSRGHRSFLLGRVRAKGWRYYYLVNLGVKTPTPLLIFGLGGIGMLLGASIQKRDWRLAAPALAFLSVLFFSSVYSNINIGNRHILILYPLLAIGAAYAVARLIGARGRNTLTLAIGGVLITWQVAVSFSAHPDNMSYFNIMAGSKPERVLIGADLDWGQDLKRLATELRTREIKSIAIAYNGSADLSQHELPEYTLLQPKTPQTGWIAISLWTLELSGESYRWLRTHKPIARVGTSINLYYIDQ
ncbi:MAG: glycosyltransferase family 39 protein [Gammaproteobacteria bacterium]